MELSAAIYVAGHRGMVGAALLRRLEQDGFDNLITATSAQLDLRDQTAVQAFYRKTKPAYVLVAAAKVGGIVANDTRPAEFIYDNLMIECNLIHGAHEAGVEKLLLLGSTCVYPRLAPQPLKEVYLLDGPLEPTNQWYAVAKIAGIKLCQAYRRQYGDAFCAVMPTNLYGPGDNFDTQTSHVLPALLNRFHQAKKQGLQQVTVWGSGTPRREFLHVDDCAEACVKLMAIYDEEEIINIGVGKDISIRELAILIKELVGFEGELVFDSAKPDGTPRKLVDVSKLDALGWHAQIKLREGLKTVYEWYCTHHG